MGYLELKPGRNIRANQGAALKPNLTDLWQADEMSGTGKVSRREWHEASAV